MVNKVTPGLRKLVREVLGDFNMFREEKASGKGVEGNGLDYVETGMLTLGNTVVPDPKCRICMQGVDHLLIIDGDSVKELVDKLIGTVLGVDPSTVVTCPSIKQAARMVSKCLPGDPKNFGWDEEVLELHGQCIIDDLRRL